MTTPTPEETKKQQKLLENLVAAQDLFSTASSKAKPAGEGLTLSGELNMLLVDTAACLTGMSTAFHDAKTTTALKRFFLDIRLSLNNLLNGLNRPPWVKVQSLPILAPYTAGLRSLIASQAALLALSCWILNPDESEYSGNKVFEFYVAVRSDATLQRFQAAARASEMKNPNAKTKIVPTMVSTHKTVKLSYTQRALDQVSKSGKIVGDFRSLFELFSRIFHETVKQEVIPRLINDIEDCVKPAYYSIVAACCHRLLEALNIALGMSFTRLNVQNPDFEGASLAARNFPADFLEWGFLAKIYGDEQVPNGDQPPYITLELAVDRWEGLVKKWFPDPDNDI